MAQKTELQILVQALTAVQYEVQALSLGIKGSDEVHAGMLQLQRDAKHLMQSAQADADLLAFLEQTREAGVQIELAEPKSVRGSGTDGLH